MIYFLYTIKSTKSGRHYIGITSNIDKRLQKHNSSGVRSTKAYIPWVLVHKEIFDSKTSARKREIFLKKNYQERKRYLDMASSSNG